MKTRRTLVWGTIILGVVLVAAGCTCQDAALPDVTSTPVGAQDAPSDGGMPDDALVTAQAQSTLTALTAEAQTAAAPEATEESPMVEPTTPPPTDIPPTDIPPTAVPPTAAPVPTTSPSSGATTTTYTVRRGDTLYSIARRYGTTVEAIAAANGIANPSRIRVGQVLKISGGTGVPAPPSGGSTYVVRRGDNLFRISLRYGISYVYLAQYNGIADPSRIYVGQVLRIPPR